MSDLKDRSETSKMSLPDTNDDPDNDEASADGKLRYSWAAVIIFALLSLPQSRFQDTFKILTWTAIVFGSYTPYVWPYLFDLSSCAVFASVCLSHVLIVYELYAHIPHEGFIWIGLAAVVELIFFSVPGGWIIVHSRSKKGS
jgi:hypothetical protein